MGGVFRNSWNGKCVNSISSPFQVPWRKTASCETVMQRRGSTHLPHCISFLFFLFSFGCAACAISVSQPGIEPGPQQ